MLNRSFRVLNNKFKDWRGDVGLRQKLRPLYPLFDVMVTPLTLASCAHMKLLTRFGISELSANRMVFDRLGLRPMHAHYYQPYLRQRDLHRQLDAPRTLPGIELNMEAALTWFKRFEAYAHESLVANVAGSPRLYKFDNGTYGAYDATVLHGVLRHHKPARFVEVGCGNSTLIAHQAIHMNAQEGHDCVHQCIEPYEMPWLEELGVDIVRERVEFVDKAVFEQLEAGDVLFIDTSHTVRAQGDVLFLMQEILPTIKPGVIIHVHDIFTPCDYPERWLIDGMLVWTEQYLLEALLTHNSHFEILFPSNYAYKNHLDVFEQVRPELKGAVSQPPTSIWLRRR